MDSLSTGVEAKQPRVRNVSRLREQTSVLTDYLDNKRKLLPVALSSFTSMRMSCSWPAEERSEYFFFKGVLYNIL